MIALAALLLLYIALNASGGWLLRQLINEAALRERITIGIKDATGLNLKMQSFGIQLTLFNGAQVVMKGAKLDDGNPDAPLISSRQVGINVRYWPLITKRQPQISRVVADDIALPKGTPHLASVIIEAQKKFAEREVDPLTKDLFREMTVEANHVSIKEPSGLNWQIKRAWINNVVSRKPVTITAEGMVNSKAVRDLQFMLSAEADKPGTPDFGSGYPLGAATFTATGDNFFLDAEYARDSKNLQVIAKPVDLTVLSQLTEEFAAAYGVKSQIPVKLSGTIAGQGKIKLQRRSEENARGADKPAVLLLGHTIDGGSGNFRLDKVTMASAKNPENFVFRDLTGGVRLNGDRIYVEQWKLFFDDSLFTANGWVDVKEELLQLALNGKNLNLDSLGQSLAEAASVASITLPRELANANVSGRADADITLSGKLKNPDYKGHVDLHNAGYRDAKSGLMLSRVNGRITLDKVISMKSLTAYVGQNRFLVSGTAHPKNKTYNLDLTGNSVNLASIKNDLANMSPALRRQLADISRLSGLAMVKLNVRNPLGGSRSPRINGNIAVTQLALQHKLINAPITIPSLRLAMAGQNITIPSTQGSLGPIPLTVQGQVRGGQYNFKAKTPTLPVSHIRDNKPFYESLAKAKLPELWNTSGNFSLDMDLSNTKQSALLALDDAGASWQGGDFPLYGVNGNVQLTMAGDRLLVQSRGLTARYGNSEANIVVDYDRKRTIRLVATGELSPLTVNHYLTSRHGTQAPYRELPFDIHLTGDALPPQNGRPRGQMQAQARLELADNPGTEKDAYLQMNLRGQRGLISIEPSVLHLADAGDVMITGAITNLREPANRSVMFQAKTPAPIEFAKLEGIAGSGEEDYFNDASGTMALDIVYNDSAVAGSSAVGNVVLDALRLPMLRIDNISGKLDTDASGTKFDFDHFDIPGVMLAFEGSSTERLRYPLPIEKLKIEGELFHVPSYQAFFDEVVEGIIGPRIAQRLFRPWQEGDPILPFEFTDADLSIREVVYDNILLNEVKGKLSMFANSFFELKDVELEAAGGKAKGYLSMNPADNNFTSLQMDTDDVKVNAVTQALLGVSNQIFGDLDGNIRFTTYGITGDDMLQNANGIVRMKITDGRLPAIAKIERLLTGANVLRGGLLGLNFNNLIRTLAPFNTNYFAEMSGDLLVVDKKIHTQNLLSDGENLDLLIQGNLTMDDGYGDLWVNGKMSQDVGRGIGKLSVGSLFRKIPLLGYLPGAKKAGVIYWIPGVGFTPGLGGLPDEFNHFRVHLLGKLDDPNVVQGFEWVSTPVN